MDFELAIGQDKPDHYTFPVIIVLLVSNNNIVANNKYKNIKRPK